MINEDIQQASYLRDKYSEANDHVNMNNYRNQIREQNAKASSNLYQLIYFMERNSEICIQSLPQKVAHHQPHTNSQLFSEWQLPPGYLIFNLSSSANTNNVRQYLRQTSTIVCHR